MTETDERGIARRQVHLDFHTSPLVEDLAVDFDAASWADGLARAAVDSVTVFAVCHHGLSYYPTALGTPHPALGGRDLLGEMIDALHARGMRAPVYVTVGWEDRLADVRPEWLQRRADGSVPQLEPSEEYAPRQHPWRFLCPNNTAYVDHIAAQTGELLERYEVDGFFFDICMLGPGGCFCPDCLALRRESGLTGDTPADNERLSTAVTERLGTRLNAVVRARRPDATIVYNSPHPLTTSAADGQRRIAAQETHWEVESLPGTHWGYAHFPRYARHVAATGRPWLGMTGRFQRMWGDFGGIKSPDALRYECFRAQAHGGACSVGDQLHPRGGSDPAVLSLIGEAYRPVRDAEPFYAGSRPLWDVAVVASGHPALDKGRTAVADEGAVGMLEELHFNPAVVDDAMDLDGYAAVVLPDLTVVTDELARRLEEYHAGGGHILLSHRAGFGEDGKWRLGFLPLTVHPARAEETGSGDGAEDPTYWRTTREFWPEMSGSDRVFYQAGARAEGGAGTRVLVERVLPYFPRTEGRHMSHLQAAPRHEADSWPAVLQGPGFTYFADPLFTGYRTHGLGFHRDVAERVLHGVAGAPTGAGLPGTVLCVPRRRGRDLLVTLLHYVPIRKALELDVVDEASLLTGLRLRVRDLSPGARCVTDDGTELRREGDGFVLPEASGRLLLRVPDHFTEETA